MLKNVSLALLSFLWFGVEDKNSAWTKSKGWSHVERVRIIRGQMLNSGAWRKKIWIWAHPRTRSIQDIGFSFFFSSSSLVALPPFLSSSFPTSFLPLLVCYVSLPFSLPCFLTIFIFSSYPYHLHRLTNKRFPGSTPEGHTNPLWVAWIFNLEKSAKSNTWWLLNKRAANGSFFISLSIPSDLLPFFVSFPSFLKPFFFKFFYIFVHSFRVSLWASLFLCPLPSLHSHL